MDKKIEKANIVIRDNQPKKDLITFLHAACGAPVPSTWVKAVKNNNFTTWPGISQKLITKHLPSSIATAKGHMKREFQGIQSTKGSQQSHDIILSLTTESELSKAYSDLCGKFPYSSSRGNNYIFVAYHYDADATLVEPLKNRNANTIVTAWENILSCITLTENRPNT